MLWRCAKPRCNNCRTSAGSLPSGCRSSCICQGLHLTAVKQDSLGVHVQGAARASAQVFDWVRQLASQTQGLQRPELMDVSAPLANPAAPLPAGVAFSLKVQPRATPASAGPGGPQTGGTP